MVFSNLVHRPLRTMISVVAIAVEVTLILLIVGLCMSMLNDNANRQKAIGFDVMVQPPGSSFFTGVTGAPAPIKVADKIRALPHVTYVAPIVMQILTTGNVEVVAGIDLDPKSPNDFDRMGQPFHYLSGGPFTGPDDIIIDDLSAAEHHAKVGDTMPVLGQKFRVCGIVEHGKGARRYLPLATLQELTGAQGKASMFYVKTDSDKNADVVVKEIKDIPGMGQYVVRSLSEYASLMTVSHMPGLSTFFNVVIGISVVIGFIVIFQSMYTAVLERTREIGILKSLGATRLYVVAVVLREAFVLSLGGVVLGLILTALGTLAINHAFPVHKVVWDAQWVLRASLIAIFGSLLGGLYPALSAARKDPIEALAYE
jgi:putative ABC transport system permease protein